MQIDVTDFDNEFREDARLGSQSMKIVEIIEKLDESRREFLSFHFVNQWEEHHYEKFYPDRHTRKMFNIASAIGEECFSKQGGRSIIDTGELVGGYFHCVLTNVELKSGDITDRAFIRMIRGSPRRKDLTKSMHFKRPRVKKVIKT